MILRSTLGLLCALLPRKGGSARSGPRCVQANHTRGKHPVSRSSQLDAEILVSCHKTQLYFASDLTARHLHTRLMIMMTACPAAHRLSRRSWNLCLLTKFVAPSMLSLVVPSSLGCGRSTPSSGCAGDCETWTEMARQNARKTGTFSFLRSCNGTRNAARSPPSIVNVSRSSSNSALFGRSARSKPGYLSSVSLCTFMLVCATNRQNLAAP